MNGEGWREEREGNEIKKDGYSEGGLSEMILLRVNCSEISGGHSLEAQSG
jgi:hypothetical protein